MSASVTGATSTHEKVPAARGKSRFASSVACAKRGVPRKARALRFVSTSSARVAEPSAGGGGTSARLSGSEDFVR